MCVHIDTLTYTWQVGLRPLLTVRGKIVSFQVSCFLWYVWIVAWSSTAEELCREPQA